MVYSKDSQRDRTGPTRGKGGKKMAWYSVGDKVKRIATLEGESIESIIIDMDLTVTREGIWATNRSGEAGVSSRLSRLEADRARAERVKAVRSGFHWVKDEEGWAVAGDFTDKKEGDDIVVLKMDGTKQLKTIERFSCSGNAYVF
jgi:hypothetical protein